MISQSGCSACLATSSLLGLLIGGTPALMIARPLSVAKAGQLEIIETLPELDKLLLSLPVELFLGLLVALTNRIALGKECGH